MAWRMFLAKSATLAWLAVIVFLTLLYAFELFELVQRAVVLISDGSPIALTMGLAIIVLPPFAVAFVLIEIRFGLSAAKLQRMVDEAGLAFDYELRPSGRAVRESAKIGFERFK
ncbi:MAG: hypothetical protein EBV93_06290, partial [Actinobacteria bacterium]|nr:hypothetical protein [Actinomycetota bacterium]